MSLSVEQIEMLVNLGATAEDILAFARTNGKPARSKGAERTARWRARRDQTVTENVTCDSHSDASPPPIDNNHTPPVSSNDETTRPPKARKAPVQPIAKPADVSAQVWGDFLRHRKAKRADVNDTVIAGIRRECAAAGWTLEAALAETVTRGWQSFKADWVDKPAVVQGDDFMSALRRKSQGVPSG